MKLNKKHITFFTLASIAFHSEAYDANMDIRSIKKMDRDTLVSVRDNYQTNYRFFDNLSADSIEFTLGSATAQVDMGKISEKNLPTRALNAACINSFLYVNNAKYNFIEEKLHELSVISDIERNTKKDLKRLEKKGASKDVIDDVLESTDVQISLIKKHQKEKYNNFQSFVTPHIEEEVQFFEDKCDGQIIDKNTFVRLYNNKDYSIDSLYEFELGLESRSDRNLAQRHALSFFHNGTYMLNGEANETSNPEQQNMCLDQYETFVAYDQYKNRLGYSARNALSERISSDSFAFEAIERTRSQHVSDKKKAKMKKILASTRLRAAENQAEFESLWYSFEKYGKTIQELDDKYKACHQIEINKKTLSSSSKYAEIQSLIGVPRF